MTKFALSFFMLIMPFICIAGPTIVGTRFIFNDDTKSLNIKIINDNESDYLIKTTLAEGNFIVSPPLFVLPKNGSNIITIIPNNINKMNKDKIYPLTITSIPKSKLNTVGSAVSFAIRSHFNLIYQHDTPANHDFNQVSLLKMKGKGFVLNNKSNFVFNLSLATNRDFKNARLKTLSPDQTLALNELCPDSRCNLWLNFLDKNNAIIKQINLTYE